jgi:hypothetical protein
MAPMHLNLMTSIQYLYLDDILIYIFYAKTCRVRQCSREGIHV